MENEEINGMEYFLFRGNAVRTQMIDSEPWFVATDVCQILDLTNPTMALNRLDEDERSKFNLGRQGEANIVNEFGLYNLVLSSRKPEAKQFKRWITHEVIPSIRKTGGYQAPVNNTKLLLRASLEHEEKIELLTDDVTMLKESMRIDGVQEFQIKTSGNKRVLRSLGGYESNAYNAFSKKVYARFWRDFKNYFTIPRYGELPKVKFDEAIEFINEWMPDTEMRLMIKQANLQTKLEV